jgi:hypothetical protein
MRMMIARRRSTRLYSGRSRVHGRDAPFLLAALIFGRWRVLRFFLDQQFQNLLPPRFVHRFEQQPPIALNVLVV